MLLIINCYTYNNFKKLITMPLRFVLEISLTFKDAFPVWQVGGWSSNNCSSGFKYEIGLLGIDINRFTATEGETRFGKLFNSSIIKNKHFIIFIIKHI